MRREFWKLAKVVKLLRGKDNIARAALINVAVDNGPPKILKRSIKQLIPIKVTNSEGRESDTLSDLSEDPTGNVGDESVNIADQSTHPIRPRRTAVALGKAARRNWTGN